MGSKTNDLFTMIESLPIDLKTALVEKLLASMQPKYNWLTYLTLVWLQKKELKQIPESFFEYSGG